MDKIIHKHEDKVIFYICLSVAVALLATSFFLPPTGMIDPSILKAVAELLGFAALAIVGKNLSMGKEVTFHHGETEVTIGDNEEQR
jgi:hypothetical protein